MPIRQWHRESLDPLIDWQSGIIRRDQALAAGMSEKALRWLLTRRRWQVVLPSTYATFTGDLTGEQRAIAATLYASPESQVTGSTRSGITACGISQTTIVCTCWFPTSATCRHGSSSSSSAPPGWTTAPAMST
ncbi:MAG: type IV toxin-antitoxin system AbiEi family antitoxin domain-containing protein [Dehalococcoidia bacterium]